MNSPVIFITGGTGGLGAGVLPRLLKARPTAHIALLIRAADSTEVQAKWESLRSFCEVSAADCARVSVFRGDVTAEHLGLTPVDYSRLCASVTDVFHLAADLRFDLPIEQSRALNVDSTRRILEFTRYALPAGNFKRLNYVSTAYISGDLRDTFHEHEINKGQGFFNAYEQSKLEAELLVECFKREAPVTIYRPSMIVGESQSGKIRNFFGIYEFLKLADRGKIRLIPAEPSARPDLVPLDYVADGLVFLSEFPGAVGRTYHLVAGVERSLPIEEIIATIGKTVTFDRLKEVPEVVPYASFAKLVTGGRLRSFQNSPLNILLKSYMPYLSFERKFDVCETARLLERHAIIMPSLASILPPMCQFAKNNHFGVQSR